MPFQVDGFRSGRGDVLREMENAESMGGLVSTGAL
jgi:hypothetical protein